MKIGHLAATTCFIFFLACNQAPKTDTTKLMAITDWMNENLKGSVKQIETETYHIDSATNQIGVLESKEIEIFDENGYITSYTKFTPKDSTTILYTYKHNPSGFMTGMTATKNGKPHSSLKIDVDSLGKYFSATSFDSTGKVDVIYTDIQSNNFGQVLSAKGLHPDSTLKMSFTNNYDSIFYTGGESKDSIGKVTYSSVITLNDKKNPASMNEISVDKDSATTTNTVYSYNNENSEGNWTEQTITVNGKPSKMLKRTITYFK